MWYGGGMSNVHVPRSCGGLNETWFFIYSDYCETGVTEIEETRVILLKLGGGGHIVPPRIVDKVCLLIQINRCSPCQNVGQNCKIDYLKI
jgi:hypothetical protein